MPDIERRTEIESHSSYLTNQRVSKIFDILNMLSMDVSSSKLNPELSMQFFGATLTLFNETHYVYTQKENAEIKQEIDNCLKEANIINTTFQYTEKFGREEVINLNQLCFRARYLMTTGLQNLKYFLRLAKQEPKGIDAALKIFKLDIWKKRELRKGKEEKEIENATPTI